MHEMEYNMFVSLCPVISSTSQQANKVASARTASSEKSLHPAWSDGRGFLGPDADRVRKVNPY